jgi:hypothetical protein
LRKKKLKIFARWECPFGLYNVEKGHFLDISEKKIAKNFSENGMSGLYKVALAEPSHNVETFSSTLKFTN